jgi:hypothetical protein
MRRLSVDGNPIDAVVRHTNVAGRHDERVSNLIIRVSLFVTAVALLLASCTSGSGSAPTASQPSASATSTVPEPAALVRLPEVLRGNPCLGIVEYHPPSVPGAGKQMVPGSPGVAVECLLPTAHAVIRGRQLDHLVSDLNALPRHRGPIKVCTGPAPERVLFFVYASGDVQSVYAPTSCLGTTITNGRFEAKATASVLQELQAAFHPPETPIP